MNKTAGSGNPVRIVLYCHNHYGLGHIIRSARIAERLLASGNFSPVLLTGCRTLDAIALPKGVPVEKLVPIPRDPYGPERFSIIANRARHIFEFIRNFAPDIVLVDTLPLGFGKELKPILQECISNPSLTTFVLGAPYPPNGGLESLFKNLYDRPLVSAYRFGMQYSHDDWGDAFDGFSFTLKKVGEILGPPPGVADPASKTILVYAGGGLVSLPLLQPVLRATERFRRGGFQVKFVAGPLADFEEMQAQSDGAPNFTLVANCAIEEAVSDARVVISRCGYNTALALLRTSLPIIFTPYCNDETGEQFTRAQRMCQYQNIRMINTLKGDYADELGKTIEMALECGYSPREFPFSSSGTDEAVAYLSEIAAQLKISSGNTINHGLYNL